jgi:Mg-chelatase subunit ChlD
MKKGLTEIVLLLDRSGSMMSTQKDAEGGLWSFIKEQRKVEGECNVTLYRFDHEFEQVFESKPIGSVEKGDLKLNPRGSTALLDAMGRAINEVGASLSKMKRAWRPDKVYFVTITDGGENASREFRSNDVFDKVKHQQEKYGWEFVFIGSNQDAIASAAKLGIAPQFSLNYAASKQGTVNAYSVLTSNISKGRTTGQAVCFSGEDRTKAMDGQTPNVDETVTVSE